MSMKSICILGLFAALAAACSTGTQQKKTDRCAAAGFDSIEIAPAAGMMKVRHTVRWMVYKNRRVVKNEVFFPLKESDEDSIVPVQISGVTAWKINKLVRELYVDHTSRDIDSLVSDDYCYDMGGLCVSVYCPGKVVRYEYDHGYAGARYSPAFNKLMELTGLEWRLPQ